MKNYNRDLLLLYKAGTFSQDLLQLEVERLHELLMQVEQQAIFCSAHELVTRSRITGRSKSILQATANPSLKPFQFLIGKN